MGFSLSVVGILFFNRLGHSVKTALEVHEHIIRVNKKLIPRVVELGDLQTEGSVTVIDN